MNSHIKPLQFALVAAGLAAGITLWLYRAGSADVSEPDSPEATDAGASVSPANPAAPESTVQASVTDAATTRKSATASKPAETAVAETAVPDTGLAVHASAALIDSPVAAEWEKQGIRREDIAAAQARMQARGYPEAMRNDPGLVRQFLPLRDIAAVHATSVKMPERAASGMPVPFRMTGVHPDASYRFDRFDIVRNGTAIRIRAIGQKSGEPAPGVEIPVELDGAIDPLPPGEYLVEFPELGPEGARTLIIE